jgi:hypothetical protein
MDKADTIRLTQAEERQSRLKWGNVSIAAKYLEKRAV